ncbi:MAG: hypothetical protein ACREOW_13045 [Thermodesulfobacteriota bacterium]
MWPTGPSRWQGWGSKPCSSVKPRADGPGSKECRGEGGSAGIFGVVTSVVPRRGAGISAVRGRLLSEHKGDATLFFLRYTEHRCQGEVICPGRCDRGISVLGHQDVTVL